MKSLKDRIFYKYKYVGDSEKHGEVYKKYKKVSRFSLMRKRIKIIMFVLLVLAVLAVVYLLVVSIYESQRLYQPP